MNTDDVWRCHRLQDVFGVIDQRIGERIMSGKMIKRCAGQAVTLAALLAAATACRQTSEPSKQTSDPSKPSGPSQTEQRILDAIAYLDDIEEVSWYEVEANSIYIGFEKRPDDIDLIVKGAAINGNKAIDFGVHAWGIVGAGEGWRPSYRGPQAACEYTARHGRIER